MLTASKSLRGVITPVAGERVSVRLINGARSDYLTLVARATLGVTVAGTSVLNRGSIWAAFDEVFVEENGKDQHIYRGNVLRFLTEMAAPSTLTALRAASAGIATTTLKEAVRIYFAHPLSIDPSETSYVERDSRQTINVGVRLAANPVARLIAGGTATLTAVSVKVHQGYALGGARGLRAPLFIPTAMQTTHVIAGTLTAESVYLRTNNLIRAIVISQETATTGEVSDIINAFTFRGDSGTFVGPAAMSFDDALLESEMEYGGAVYANGAHYGLNFQKFGKLSECFNPAQDSNPRFEFDAQVSVAGVGASIIRITRVELVRDSLVTAPDVPFSY